MAKTAKIANRTRAFGDNLAGLDARRRRQLPDWVVGVIAWLGAPALALIVFGLLCLGLAALALFLQSLARSRGWLL